MSKTADKKDVPLSPPDNQPPPDQLKVPSKPKKTRWAVVGLGVLTVDEILPAIITTDSCSLTALVSDHRDKAEQIAKVYGVKSERIYNYDNFDEISSADDIDIVYIVLPNSQHAEFTIRALKAGKHVLCEKPMAPSVADCERMISAAKESGKLLMIAYRLRYEPNTMKAIQIMRSGRLGKLRIFDAIHSQTTEAPNIRLSTSLAGGPVQDVGIYCLNAARYISGEEPIAVSALGVHPEGDERFKEVPGHTSFQLKFPSGALALCSCGFDSIRSDRFRGTCEKGYVEMEPAFGYTGLKLSSFEKREKEQKKDKKNKKDDEEEEEEEEEDQGKFMYEIQPKNHFAEEMEHFSKCVKKGKQPRTPGEEGLKDIRVIEKIEESMKQDGKMLKI